MGMSKKNHFDAVVIGSGPAGATAAYILATRGYRVLIIEKKKFPRAKLCGGLLTQKTITLIEDIFGTGVSRLKTQGVIHYQSREYGVRDRNGAIIGGILDFPFHFVERKLYDQFWLVKAVRAGAKVVFNEKAVTFSTTDGKVTTHNGSEFYGDFILGADGVFSRIRTGLIADGLIHNKWRRGLATALTIFVPRKKVPELANFPNIYYGYVPWGYAWSFPGQEYQIIGICGLNQKNPNGLRVYFNAFLESQTIPKRYCRNQKSYALPYGNYLTTPGYKNILLIGDAAGFVDPLLGEGIYYAHKSGQIAARAVEHSQSIPENALAHYANQLNQIVIPELKFAKLSRQLIFSLPRRWYFNALAIFLKRIPRICEETVQGQRSFKWLRPNTPRHAS
jgi:geranylgeranyl reductase family protein